MDTTILWTAYISVIAQVITMMFGFHGWNLNVQSKYHTIKELLILETIVQIIELVYYGWLITSFKDITYDVTYTRYFDWMLSTPIMLINTGIYMKFASNPSESNSFWKLFLENSSKIHHMWFANLIMLMFGYLGEKKYLGKFTATLWGSLAFLYTFFVLYSFVGNEADNQTLFWFMFIVWAFYGVAYLFPYSLKNSAYNLLDIFSKNFYGMFLYFKLSSLTENHKSSGFYIKDL